MPQATFRYLGGCLKIVVHWTENEMTVKSLEVGGKKIERNTSGHFDLTDLIETWADDSIAAWEENRRPPST